jgi:hypothetical protein
VANWVPILRHHHIFEARGDAIDDRDDLIAILHRKAASRQEAILHVDHQQHRIAARYDLLRRDCKRGATRPRGSECRESKDESSPVHLRHVDLHHRKCRAGAIWGRRETRLCRSPAAG